MMPTVKRGFGVSWKGAAGKAPSEAVQYVVSWLRVNEQLKTIRYIQVGPPSQVQNSSKASISSLIFHHQPPPKKKAPTCPQPTLQLHWAENLGLLQVFVDRQHHVGSELLGSQAVAPTDADDVRLGHGLQGGAHLQEERLTLRALLLSQSPRCRSSVTWGKYGNMCLDLDLYLYIYI